MYKSILKIALISGAAVVLVVGAYVYSAIQHDPWQMLYYGPVFIIMLVHLAISTATTTILTVYCMVITKMTGGAIWPTVKNSLWVCLGLTGFTGALTLIAAHFSVMESLRHGF